MAVLSPTLDSEILALFEKRGLVVHTYTVKRDKKVKNHEVFVWTVRAGYMPSVSQRGLKKN